MMHMFFLLFFSFLILLLFLLFCIRPTVHPIFEDPFSGISVSPGANVSSSFFLISSEGKDFNRHDTGARRFAEYLTRHQGKSSSYEFISIAAKVYQWLAPWRLP